MESSERLIELYRMGFIICLCLAAVFLLLSIFFFFKFRIRDVFDFLSGRAEKKSVKQMEEKNAKTGKLRDDYYAEPLSSELYKTAKRKSCADDVSADRTNEYRNRANTRDTD